MDIDAKLRPLYLLRILKEQTDENHKLSTVQLCQILKDEYGIDTFRTTIKTDIEALQQAGYMIRATRSSQNLYNYQERDFDQQEIKALLDAVSVSQMLSENERDQLMNKLCKLVGPFKAHELKRNWFNQKNSSPDTAQTMRIIEAINDAINSYSLNKTESSNKNLVHTLKIMDKATKNFYGKLIETDLDASDVNQTVLEQQLMREGLYNPYDDEYFE